jgi:prepilin signal peptidase PulO-like enzyme (type II secretory pathway)
MIDIWAVFCLFVLTICLIWLAIVDLRTGYLPEPLQWALALSGLAVALVGSPIGISWSAALIGAAVNGAVFWGLRWLVSRLKGREAMGFGDIKLVAAGGLWLGPWALPLIMAAGGILTLAGAGVVGVIRRKPILRGEMPLGPGLAAGILGSFIAALAKVSWLMLVPF